MRNFLLSLTVFASILCWSPPAWAQASSATLQGSVTDSVGAPAAGAAVTAASSATGLRREVVTNAAGIYVVNFLPAGRYTVTASLTGFKSLTRENVVLEVGETLTLDFRLEVGGREEVITVTEEAPPLDRATPQLSTVVGATQLMELPVNGRHWASLMMLAPGAINTGAGNQLSIRFFGRSVDDNNWTLDGIDATGVKDPKQESVARLIISMDSISEFRVSSALYSAEAGSAGGGQVQLISKSGTNDFRGTVYDFVRNDKFDAPAFGDVGDPPPFRLNQFGASLGGPLIKDKTFFFVNYEGLRQRQTSTFVGFVPSAAFRVGAAPAVAEIVRAYPQGTGRTSDPNIDEWVTEQKTVSDENALMVRLDHRFSPDFSVFARYSMDRANINTPQNTGQQRDRFRPSNLSVQSTNILSPSTVNELRFGFNKSLLRRTRSGFGQEVTVPGFITLTGDQETIENGRSFSFLDNLAVVKGRHNVKVGFEVRRIFVAVGEGDTTTLNYANRPDFSANRLNTFQIVDFPVNEGRRWYYLGYVQDDIKWRPNLTFNVGLRYEYYSVVNDKEDRSKVFALRCGGFCPPGSAWYDADKNNIAPRLGLTWAPGRFNSKTVVRGGVGIFYGPGQNDDVFAPLDNSGNRIGLDRRQAPSLAYPIDPFLSVAATTGRAPRALDPDREDLYVTQYSLSVQQQLPAHFVMQVGYVGSQGHHLFARTFYNTIDPATGTRPLPTFGQIDAKSDDGNSNFHGLQVSLHRSFVKGFLLGAQYMWSHSINDGSVGGGDGSAPQNVRDRKADRGDSAQDVRHTGTVNWVYELPFGKEKPWLSKGWGASVFGGWELSGLLQARTGQQLTVTVSRARTDMPDANASTGSTTSGSTQRPDLVPAVAVTPPGGKSPALWVNPAAFAVPARGKWGNAGRGLVDGPSLVQLDVALQRRFGSSRNVEFRWEVFNVFNRANLANPELNISTGPAFGRITGPANSGFGTGSARQMQFMLRLNF